MAASERSARPDSGHSRAEQWDTGQQSDTVGTRHPVKPTKPGPLSGLDLSEDTNNTPPWVRSFWAQ
ncbi:MAG: hypothetical protein AAGK66_09845 [Pseudomonadota bacterium]